MQHKRTDQNEFWVLVRHPEKNAGKKADSFFQIMCDKGQDFAVPSIFTDF